MARRSGISNLNTLQVLQKQQTFAEPLVEESDDEDLKMLKIKKLLTKNESSDSDSFDEDQGPDHEHFINNMLEKKMGRVSRAKATNLKDDRLTQDKGQSNLMSDEQAERKAGEIMDFSSDSEEEKQDTGPVSHLAIILEAAKKHDQNNSSFDNSSSSSSNESDDEIDAKLNEISKGAANQMVKMSTAFRVMILDRANPVALVGLHEESGQLTCNNLTKAANLLTCYDKDFYNISRQILKFSEVPQLSRQLFEERGHAYFGNVNCVKLFRAKSGTMLFVGNSSGYIQVFDTQTQKQRKPLFVPQLAGNQVMCIDISDNGQYLFAGYKKGTLALWDCARFRLAHLMTDVALDQNSAFSCVKYLFTGDQTVINIVTAEESGRMRHVQLQKRLLGAFQHISNSLLKNVATIEVQKQCKWLVEQSSFCQQACLTAFGAIDTVTIVDMQCSDVRRPIKIIQRPPICYDKAIPTLSWGYGLTPSDRNKSKPLLAIAWDKCIKLMFVTDENRELELEACGFYCSDFEINQVYFISDSLLAIVVNNDEVRILSTDCFKAGDIHLLTKNKQPHEIKKEFQNMVHSSKACELEKDHSIIELKRHILSFNIEKTRQTAKYVNVDNTICQNRSNMAFICNNQVVIAKIHSWQDFMRNITQSGHDWLTVLKVALQIYKGDMKGFAMLPAAQILRQSFMQDYMKNLLLTSIQTVVNKYHQAKIKSENPPSPQNQGGFSIEEVAIRVSIEFCLTIKDVEFLFAEIYSFFEEKGLSQQFVKNLQSPIIAGSFQRECVPSDLLLKLIRAEEEKREYSTIELIILNINMMPYNGKVNQQGQSIRKILKQVSQKHCLIGAALLLLQTSQKLRIAKQDCTLVLNMLLNTMETQKANFELALRRNENPVRITKEDMRMLRNAKKSRRQEIEQSAYYVGYRLFWILGLFLKGKKFPTGQLDAKQYKIQVLNIVDFVTNEDNLATMLDFDSEAFFEAMAQLFTDKPWEFITNHGKYQFEFEKIVDNAGTPRHSREDSSICNVSIANNMLTIFKQAAERYNRKESAFTKASFQEFLLKILVSQEVSFGSQNQRNSDGIPRIEMNYDLVLQAIKSLFKTKQHGEKSIVTDDNYKGTINEYLVTEALKVVQLENCDIDQLIQLSANTKTTTTNLSQVKIQLYEKKQDYQEAFMQILNQESERRYVFTWVSDTLTKLKREEVDWKHKNGFFQEQTQESAAVEEETKSRHSSDSDDDHHTHEQEPNKRSVEQEVQEDKHPYPPLEKLKKVVKDRMLKLAQYNCEQTIVLIENFFNEGDFQERLIMSQFSKYPKEQMNYLTNFILKNEKEIELTMQDRTHNPSKSAKYERYIVQFTKLLCSQDEAAVEQWVSRTYFPVEKCLKICQEASNSLGEAILTMRSGRPHAAIDLYCQILTDFPILGLLEQIKLLYKDEPCFLNDLIEDDEAINDDQARENFNTLALTQISNFDTIIGKACQICMLDELDIEERQKGWFLVLRYLQKFKSQADKKCVEAINKAVQLLGSEKYSSIHTNNKQVFIEKLQNFIDVRIDYILKFPSLPIPLKILVEQLQLSVDQIKHMTNAKMKHSGTTFWIEQTQNIVMKGQLCDMIKDGLSKRGTGYLVEPQKRIEPRGGRKKCAVSSICCLCIGSITSKPHIVIYSCGHEFHLTCLRAKQIENESNKCPLCLKIDYQAIREEIDKLMEKQLRKKTNLANLEGEGDLALVQQASMYGDFNVEEEVDMAKFNQNMNYKKLDQFDVILDDINLELSEFEEEMRY